MTCEGPSTPLQLTPASLMDATRVMIAGGCAPAQLARAARQRRSRSGAELAVPEIIGTMVDVFTTEPPRVPYVYTAQLSCYASEHPAAVVALGPSVETGDQFPRYNESRVTA